MATIGLSKSPTFLSNICKGVKIFHFSSEIIFGQLLLTFGDFLLVTLPTSSQTHPAKTSSSLFQRRRN